MRAAAGHVLPPHPLVERDRRVNLAHYIRRAGGEAPAPHLMKGEGHVRVGSGRLAMAGLLAALCATAACDKASPANGQAEANTAAPAEPPVSPDEAAPSAPASRAGAVDRSHAGEAPPAAAFTDAAGKRATIADFKGHAVLVNLWATWCAPCVKELPTLDAVAKGGDERRRDQPGHGRRQGQGLPRHPQADRRDALLRSPTWASAPRSARTCRPRSSMVRTGARSGV
ncbi:TlpA family protein disulfide reductase [Sphingomonas sp. MMS24-JH45]